MWNKIDARVFSFINLITIACELKQICAIILFSGRLFFLKWKQPIELKILPVCIFLIYMSVIHELIKENHNLVVNVSNIFWGHMIIFFIIFISLICVSVIYFILLHHNNFLYKQFSFIFFPQLISIQNNNFICRNNFMSLISIQNNIICFWGYNFFWCKNEFNVCCNKYISKK